MRIGEGGVDQRNIVPRTERGTSPPIMVRASKARKIVSDHHFAEIMKIGDQTLLLQ